MRVRATGGSSTTPRRIYWVSTSVGYLSYDNRYADLLYEVIDGRHQRKSTILTTNRPFSQWPEIFPNAVSVVTLVDRVTHHAEIVKLVGDSYRHKEATEERQAKAAAREARRATR